MRIFRLEDFRAWQEARKLCGEIYGLADFLPKHEDFNIKKHLRESARGTASNIGEGFGRHFFKESLRFYGIARGCLNEVKSDVYLCYDLSYINKDKLDQLINQIITVDSTLNGVSKHILNQINK